MKTIKQVALAVFHQPPESYNCAQAVLHGYREVSGDRETMPVVEMKAFGGGHAPGGFCGALHAACTVAPAKAEELHEKFARHMGSAICKELRAAKEKRCQDCVGTAAELLETELKSRDNLH